MFPPNEQTDGSQVMAAGRVRVQVRELSPPTLLWASRLPGACWLLSRPPWTLCTAN